VSADVIKLFHGRVRRGKALPKPVECKECEEPIETARLQVLMGGAVCSKALRCVSCESAYERRFNRQMEGVRANQTVQIIR
jgi:hypothetical protein